MAKNRRLYQKNITLQARSWPKIEGYIKKHYLISYVMPKNRRLYQKKTLPYRLGHAQKSKAISQKINLQARSWPKIEGYLTKTLPYRLGHGQKSKAISKKTLPYWLGHCQKSKAISKNITLQARSCPKIEGYLTKNYLIGQVMAKNRRLSHKNYLIGQVMAKNRRLSHKKLPYRLGHAQKYTQVFT